MGRLVCHFSDTSGIVGLEPKVDSEPYTGEIIELIEACFRVMSHPWRQTSSWRHSR